MQREVHADIHLSTVDKRFDGHNNVQRNLESITIHLQGFKGWLLMLKQNYMKNVF